MKREKKQLPPDKIATYFQGQSPILAAVTVSGLIYNLGLLAGPWFQGQMAGCLAELLEGRKGFSDMLALVASYMLSIALVQAARYLKRLYVRKFANNVNRQMKETLFGTLVRKSRLSLNQEGAGNVMTKAIGDVDDCAEGMRKFTTEVFDTGVAMAAFAGMLLYYDWRLALLSLVFTPISYYLAEKLKTLVQRTGAEFKVQAGRLSAATLDRAANAVTYRVYGCEQERRQAYETQLTDYERSAVKANILSGVMQPLYKTISLTGVLVILYFGSRNVLGTGWANWDIAVFTTFLSCFSKLSAKSSSAAKLFNAVHKAQVSWNRIRPLMKTPEQEEKVVIAAPAKLEVSDLGFAYPEGTPIFTGLSFSAEPGQIIGVTGPVACGKSTLGKVFLREYPYEGSIRFGGQELSGLNPAAVIGYLGHDPELFDDSIQANVLLGDRKDAAPYLKAVCLDKEVAAMEQGENTIVGSSGVRLSGGQAQRLALARTLCHKRPVLILDDPFSALDKNTERQVFAHLKEMSKDSIVILLSHRLYLFPELDGVIWMENGRTRTGTHREMMALEPHYAKLYREQEGDAAL